MSEPVKHYRSDYTPPAFEVESLFLDFRLGEEGTDVLSEIKLRRNGPSVVGDSLSDLVLDGEELELRELSLNETALDSSAYEVSDSTLTLPASLLPSSADETFQLNMTVRMHPETNTALMGLYKSSGNFFTQCEAEGFRRITYFLDRPDVLTRYLVRVEAEKERYPVLLSNGNLVDSGDAEADGRHFAVWEDPFKKPSYLFALVAGDLGHIHDTFTTMSGKEVAIGFYSEHANVDQLQHALDSLKKSMKYDEEAFGRECDLDMYNVVAVGDFNMGAMENKGLNIFNTACVLADAKKSTDRDFAVVEGVIFHEYAHNWSGNRVTLRDWFQLTLKEGFTVYRDSRFSAAMTDEVVKRIEDVKLLRARQFVEDSGPTAHPIRPEHYVAMDNFYTLTVYEKGCEVVRMYERLFGRDGLRKGTDLYFDRFDGMAVTCDDFRLTMAEANDTNLDQFERWYSQAGTPTVRVQEEYKADEQTYVLTLSQVLPSTPDQAGEDKLPHHIPIEICYYDESGDMLIPTQMLELKEMEQQFVFENVARKGMLSVNRDFTAPVIVDFPRDLEEVSALLRVDDDGFSKWEYAQQLATESFMRVLENPESVGEAAVLFTEPVGHLLQATRDFVVEGRGDPVNLNVISYCIDLPDETTLGEEVVWKRGPGSLNPGQVHEARVLLKRHVAESFRPLLLDIYQHLHAQEPEQYQYNAECVGRRSLKNACLGYLSCLSGEEVESLLFE
jgi:aminopeptidase N